MRHLSHCPIKSKIPNRKSKIGQVRRRAPVVGGARNAMCALDLSRVRRFFARFKKPVVFSKIKIVGTQAAIGPQATSLQ
jgi:hypothetical protein